MFRKKMNNIKASSILPVLLALLCIALPVICLAQGPPDPEDTPVDGGLGLLLAAGAAYGVNKYRKYKAVGKEETI